MSAPLPYLKTPAVARQLSVPYWRVIGLIRWGAIDPPAKDSSGDYAWLPEDVERARRALEDTRSERGVPA